MPIKKKVDVVAVRTQVRWPGDTRLSLADRVAIDEIIREQALAIQQLADSVRELQSLQG